MANTEISRWNGRFAYVLGFGALTALLAILVGWGMFAQISGAVLAPGVVEVASNRQVVQHPEGGIVSEIRVRNGDFVETGDVLMLLDTREPSSELAIFERQLFELLVKSERLRAERNGAQSFELVLSGFDHVANSEVVSDQRQIFFARKESFENEIEKIGQKIAQIREQIGGVEAQLRAKTEQIKLFEQEIQAKETLNEKGLLVVDRLLEMKRLLAQLEGEQGALVSLRAQHFSSIAELELEKSRASSDLREQAISELRELELRITDLSGKRHKLLRQIARAEIKAPSSGVIYGSRVFALRSVVQRAEEVMYVVPQNEPLVVKAQVQSTDVEQLTIGQSVTLRFSSFDQKFTPEIFGTLSKISADRLVDDVTGMPFYEVEVSPEVDAIQKLDGQTILPGMPVETFFKTANRTPLNYLSKPLLDYFYRAFRES